MKDGAERSLRAELVKLLEGGQAHVTFDDAIEGFPPELRGKKVHDLPYSAWMLLEHMRIAQWDILEFSRSAKHESPKFPEDYWPATAAPANDEAWNESIKSLRSDLKAMQKLVSDPEADLYKPFPWGDGQNLLREAMLVADHNAYHLGEFVMLRRLLGVWRK
jgi:hypothetical protein